MKKDERVLAYTLAKEIEPDELSKISGGGHLKYSTRSTCKASGIGNGLDIFIDISVDA